ncbi:hypothetical protein Pgin02_02014 [Porphyromonas gingivalis]
MNYVQNLADDLFMQLGICRVGDILLLNSRIDKSNVMMFVIITFVIDTNAFLENEFYPLFSNAMAKMHQFGRGTGNTGCKLLHTTKVLVISILTPLLHNGFIREITKMLEYQQATHQTNRLTRATIVLTVQRPESRIEFLPIYFVGQFVEWVRLVQHV